MRWLTLILIFLVGTTLIVLAMLAVAQLVLVYS